MIKFSNFCGIFATVFVTTTIILLASCSQDDDYYESDMYTLAEMGTRLGAGDEWGYDIQDNECGIWCLVHLKGGYDAEGQIRGVIKRNHIDISNGIRQSDMVRIGDSIGLEFHSYISDLHMIIDPTTNDTSIVDKHDSTVQKLVELGGESGTLGRVILNLTNHYVVGLHVDKKKKSVLYVDDKGQVEHSFDVVTGIIW
jgi:hypothetical protein